jgi:YesN/AraC family two-component response regulator
MTILIVDDEEIVRKVIRVALKGFVEAVVVLEAKDAAEALKIARQHSGHIDLLISDVSMPGMNGTEMAAQLSHTRPEMKVFLMSGYAPEALTMEPSWSFIEKPFAAMEIQERIWRILSEKSIAA